MKANRLTSRSFQSTGALPQRQPVTAHVLHRLLSGIRFGTLILIEQGQQHEFGEDTSLSCRVRVHSNAVYSKILRGGAVGAAEAYMDGDWSTDNLTDLIRLMVRNRAVLENMQSRMSWLSRLGHAIYHHSRRDTIDGSKRNIADHYDLGNEFFQLFLDATMMYSSGVFRDANDTM